MGAERIGADQFARQGAGQHKNAAHFLHFARDKELAKHAQPHAVVLHRGIGGGGFCPRHQRRRVFHARHQVMAVL